jgi:hypothetical protein
MKPRKDLFAPMTEPEYSSAVEALVERGFAPADFVLEERCSNVRQPGGKVKIHKLVSVKRITTGFQRQYNCGPGGGWPYEFGRDLGQLSFGAKNAPSTQESD